MLCRTGNVNIILNVPTNMTYIICIAPSHGLLFAAVCLVVVVTGSVRGGAPLVYQMQN